MIKYLKRPKTPWNWIQPISFQAIWLSAILGGNEWLFIPISIIIIHFIYTPKLLTDLKVIPLSIIGFCIDMTLTHLGVFQFNQWPYWLIVVWLAFVLNFGHSLRFFQKLRLSWLIIIGAAGGLYAYWASWNLGAVEWPYGLKQTSIIVAIEWAIMLPMLVKADELIRRKSNAQ